MEEKKQVSVPMTEEERTEFEAFKQQKAKKAAEVQKKQERDAYRQMVGDTVDSLFPELIKASEQLATLKQAVYDNFHPALEMKAQIIGIKDEQRSNAFINNEGTRRITLGYHITDAYSDTVNDGIAIVKDCLQSLAKDEQSRALIATIMRLLSRDEKGNLKASRVLQLRRTAEEFGNERLLEGVRIIEESYAPAQSKQYIRAEYKDDTGAWRNLPLGMTES